jgi:Alkylmercury lyase
MTIEVLYFDDCPNHDGFVPHLRELLAEHGVAADVTLRRIDSDADAQRFRFLGSPSVRVDDRDVEPGADARTDFGMKCRLYRTPDALTGVPRDRWVLDALGLDPRENDGRVLAEDLLGQRSARDRLEGCPPAYRRLHRRVLQAFVEGEPTRGDDLARWSSELAVELDDAVAELERHDVLWRDPATGGVATAYPFSGTPTPHRVRLAETGVEVFAMCALDALGIPYLAHQPARIVSHDPVGGARIEIWIDPGGERRWEPAAAAVTIGISGDGPSASCCCPHLNFLSDPAHAGGATLGIDEATDIGRRIFGSLLDDRDDARG